MTTSMGDNICGNITADSDGYISTSFVYKKGFSLLVDGEKVEPVKINKAFLGIPVKKGTHHIEIQFKAPFLTAGKVMSALGISLLVLCLIIDIIFDRKFIYALLRNIFAPSGSKKRRTVHS